VIHSHPSQIALLRTPFYLLYFIVFALVVVLFPLPLFAADAARSASSSVSPPIFQTQWSVSNGGYPHLEIFPPSTAALHDYFKLVQHPLVFPPTAEQHFLPLVLNRLPHDYNKKMSSNRRKALFIAILMPKILLYNFEIGGERAFLESLPPEDASIAADSPYLMQLNTLYKRYGVKAGNRKELLLRVDTLPPALVVGQAVMEGGWGVSRFARQGNALFGMKSGKHRRPGIATPACAQDRSECYRSFDSLTDSVAAYMHGLNTHKAYAGMRALRAEKRQKGMRQSAFVLAGGLQAFSERGDAYIADLRSMISHNQLEQLDEATLGFVPQKYNTSVVTTVKSMAAPFVSRPEMQ
jgi:uncharacterized FlgJ-related protein